MTQAAEINRALAHCIVRLASGLLPGGRRVGNEWRVGSLAGEAGMSLGVHLAGRKAGVWCDFATGEKGDAVGLVRAAKKLELTEAVAWARRWLGIEDDSPSLRVPARLVRTTTQSGLEPGPDRWRYPWQTAQPIVGTLAETYLSTRRVRFQDPEGRVLRFARWRARKNPDTDELEWHPALLCSLADIKSGAQCGLINIYLHPDGRDRLRDGKGKTCTGRASGAVVMLSDFDEPTAGLVIAEGVETAIAIFRRNLRPIWACGSRVNLAAFPVLEGIEALTIAADQDEPGRCAAEVVARRWRSAGRPALVIAPPGGDWADPR